MQPQMENRSNPAEKAVPIGVFDSGVGGLSVLRAIRQRLPAQPVIYLADQAHVPYGSRTLDEVRGFSKRITQFLLDRGARLIVVACNTASAAALQELRAEFDDVPFVGMEPAVKPAAETTRTGIVGVIATPATFQGRLYASVVERFANGVIILQDTCPGLVTAIENGELETPETRAILERALNPMLEQHIDTVVLGCTHFPFVIPLIQQIVGPDVRVIDPAPAVARQVERLLENHGWTRSDGMPGAVKYYTSAAREPFDRLLPLLTNSTSQVQSLRWDAGKLRFRSSEGFF